MILILRPAHKHKSSSYLDLLIMTIVVCKVSPHIRMSSALEGVFVLFGRVPILSFFQQQHAVTGCSISLRS